MADTITKILSELRAAGYKVTPHLFKFEDYGVPQARHRIIIIGIRSTNSNPWSRRIIAPAWK